MHTEQDVSRIVRSWLRTDEHESANRVLSDVLAVLDTTPQRRSTWPVRRIADMNSYAKLAIAAAAVVAIAVLGLNLLPAGRSPAVGGPPASPSTSPSAPTSASASPESRTWPVGDLPAQRYHVTLEGVPLSFALPSTRWRSDTPGELLTGSGSPHTDRGDDYAWILPAVQNTDAPVDFATDPCAGEARPVEVSSLDDHAAAYTTIAGTTAQEPEDVTLGGHPAKLVELTVDPDPPCDIDSFWLFGQTSLHPNSVNSIIRIWIADVDGQRYTVFADQASADPRVEREIQQIVDSIQFE